MVGKAWRSLLVLALVPVAGIAASAGPVRADAETAVEMSRFGDIAVDPLTGRVLVSGDDHVLVFDPDGTAVTTIDAIPGAASIAIEGRVAYVVATTSDEVIGIDLDALAVVTTTPAGVELGPDIAVIEHIAWLFADLGDDRWGLRRLDLTTGRLRTRGFENVDFDALEEIPGDPLHLIVYERRTSLPEVVRLDILSNPVREVVQVRSFVSNIEEMAVSDVERLMVAGPALRPFPEADPTSLEVLGVQHGTASFPGPWPNGVAYSAARNGVYVGTTGHEVQVFRPGTPLTTHRFVEPDPPVAAGVELSPDADRVYVLTRTDATHVALRTHGLLAALSGVTPSVVVATTPTSVHLTGPGLAAATDVRLEGSPVPFARASSTELIVQVNPLVAESPQTITVATPFGDVSTDIQVDAPVGATLSGTVTELGEPVAGAQVFVSGSGFPVATTTAAGAFVATGLSYDPFAEVFVDSPSGANVRLGRVALRPNESTTLDVEMSAPQQSAEISRAALPPGEVRDLLVGPDGRVFVSVGDHVAVFDPLGRPVATVGDQWTAAGLVIVGESLWVNLLDGGRLNQIDLDTLRVVGTIETRRPTLGDVVYANGDLWTTDKGVFPDDAIVAFDPTTGEPERIRCWNLSGCDDEVLVPIEGDDDRFISRTTGLYAPIVTVWDVAERPVSTRRVSTDLVTDYPPPETIAMAASADHDRLWSATGHELVLSILADSGVAYDAPDDALAITHAGHTEGRPGAFGIGNRIFVEGTSPPTHLLPDAPAKNGLGIDPYLNNVFVATAEGELVTSYLWPAVRQMVPYRPYSQATVTLHGGGFGSVISVRLADDGREMDFEAVSTTELRAELPTLSVGRHMLLVETAFGQSIWFPFVTTTPPAPTLTGITPSVASSVNPTTSVVSGNAFVDVTGVQIGGTPVPFEVTGPRSIEVTMPARSAGSSGVVQVTTAHGTSTLVDAPDVTWIPPPVVTSVTPAAVSGAGPSTVTLTGSGLSLVTAVSLDGVDLSGFHPFDDGHLGVTLPAHRPGPGVIAVSTAVDTAWAPVQFLDPPAASTPPALSERVTIDGALAVAGDFDGNGVEDVFSYTPGSAPDALLLFDPDGRPTTSPQFVSGTYRPVAGDFTGDGVDDILWYAPGAAADTMWDFNLGGGRTNRSAAIGGSFTPVAGDFTGDDVDDVLLYAPGAAPDRLWDYNAGGGHAEIALTVNGTSFRPISGDFTGDGVDDITWYAPGSAPDFLWDFDAGGAHSSAPLSVSGVYVPTAGDFTGDGADDVLWYAPGSAPDFLWDFAVGGSRTTQSLAVNGTYRPVAADLTGGGVSDVVFHGAGTAADFLWFMTPVVR